MSRLYNEARFFLQPASVVYTSDSIHPILSIVMQKEGLRVYQRSRSLKVNRIKDDPEI